ncbi:MAG: glycosyltransferase family 2 protein, partial [Rudaea sp.]
MEDSSGRGVLRNAPLISVLVVNYNGRAQLERCLPALAAQTHPSYEVILVDNASTDDSVAWLAAHYPSVRVIKSPENLGFAAGNNLGIRAARGRYIATLNNDTVPEREYLVRLVEPMRDPLVGSVAALMLRFDSPSRIDSAGIRVDALGFAWNRRAGEPELAVTGESEVWGACAGAALYRRAMLDEIGLFDEGFFAFYEDVDLAWRARRAGWECVLAPEARVLHVHGASFHHGSPRKLYLLARNRWWTLFKNTPRRTLAPALPFILLADVAALAFSLARYRSLAPLKGRIAAWLKPMPQTELPALRGRGEKD